MPHLWTYWPRIYSVSTVWLSGSQNITHSMRSRSHPWMAGQTNCDEKQFFEYSWLKICWNYLTITLLSFPNARVFKTAKYWCCKNYVNLLHFATVTKLHTQMRNPVRSSVHSAVAFQPITNLSLSMAQLLEITFPVLLLLLLLFPKFILAYTTTPYIAVVMDHPQQPVSAVHWVYSVRIEIYQSWVD